MPAESEKQAHLMQMALAVKSGKKELSDMPEGVRDKIKNIVDNMSKEKIKHFTINEEGEGGAPSTGAATLSNTVGRGSYSTGNNPQNGNSDQAKGSGEVNSGNQQRKLTPEEEAMLGIANKSKDGSIKVIGYDDFRAKSVKENFVPVKRVMHAINVHLGDFGNNARTAVNRLPVINDMVEVKSINEALSGIYNEKQIRKVIDAISNRRGS